MQCERVRVRLYLQERRVRDGEDASCCLTLSANDWPVHGTMFLSGHAYPPAYS